MKETGVTLQSSRGWSWKFQPLELLLFAVVIFVVGTGWYVSFHYKNALRQAITASYQETQLEIVRSVARSTELYVRDEFDRGTDITTIEQNILKRFITPIHLLENGDAWIYAPDHVVFDLSSDFPDEYRNKNMAEIFAIQLHAGASHYEEMTEDVLHAREGVGWYIWLPEKGPEIAAWTPVKFGNHVWVIGLSTPLFEILEATQADTQELLITRILIIVTILCISFLVFTLLSKARRRYLENETYEIKAKLQALIEAIPDIIFFKDTKGRNLLVNKAFETMVGKNREDILGKTDSEFYPARQSQLSRQSDEQVIKSRKPYHAEEKYLNNKNETIFLDTKKIPLFNNKNELIGLVGITRDITEYKRNEEALEKRIVALTRALDDIESITFEELFNLDDIQRLQDEFSKATGVGSVITNLDGTPITRFSNFCRLCKIIRKTDKGMRNCFKSDAILGQYNPEGPTIQPCLSGGLWDAGAPISIGGRHIATWLVGQVRDETQSEDKIRAYAKEIGADEDAVLEAFLEVPSMSHEQFTWIAQVLFTLANQLSTTAYQNIQQARFIVERKKIENSLRTSTERYKALTELLPIGVIEIDTEGNVLFANQAISQMTLYNRNDLNAGLKVQHIVAPQDHEKITRMMDQILAGTFPDGNEYQIIRKDGSAFTGFINSRLYIIESVQRLIGYIFDLSTIKEKEKALFESEEKLARLKKMESLGLLAGGVAHDLNNILSGIVSYPELILLDMTKDNKLRKPIESILEAGTRATAIVQDLLTVARGVAIAKEPVSLNNLIKKFLNSPEFKKTRQFNPKITFDTDLDSELFNVNASSVHLRKALMNLVSNAAEAIPGTGNVTISTKNCYLDRPVSKYSEVKEGEYALLTVADNGPGISDKDLERIFEPFYTKKIMGRSGTGLGLAVVWSVVQDHQGYIDVETSERGTIFRLFFQITRSDEAIDSTTLNIEDYSGNGETILVIDDVDSQREISRKMLERLGYSVQSVSNGEKAVEYLNKQPVDLLLLDMIMEPGISGYETYKRIIQTYPDQKAIIVSGFAETTAVRETQALGAGKYLKKPLTLEKLGIAVKEELQSK